jgi:REP element-mobilizing transposase RayT
MPDHVHVLATPLERGTDQWYPLSEILHNVKRRSARLINKARGQTGALWQSESHDRIMRDEAEFDEKANYILNNAAKRGLVEDPWEYDGFWCEEMEVHRLLTCATRRAAR